MLRLNTFTISHFSEKARWALDFEGISFKERTLLPGVHMPIIRRMAPGTSVPVLEHDGHVVQGSSAILDYMDQKLGARRLKPPESAAERAVELEARADLAFGLGVQTIFYYELLRTPRIVIDLWTQDGPPWGRRFYKFAYPVCARVIRRMYRTERGPVERARDRFFQAADEIDAALGRNRYILGDTPTRVDITVASLFAPVCRPPEHIVRWPTPEGALASFCAAFEGRPIWDFVRRMYREDRLTSHAGIQ